MTFNQQSFVSHDPTLQLGSATNGHRRNAPQERPRSNRTLAAGIYNMYMCIYIYIYMYTWIYIYVQLDLYNIHIHI